MKDYRQKIIENRGKELKFLTREQLEESYIQLLKMSFMKTELMEDMEKKRNDTGR